MRDLLQNKWDTVISVQQKNYIISAIKQRKTKKNRLKMLSHFRNDSCLTTYLTTLELSRKRKSQKPWKFKVSDSSVNRGWENRTPTKGFGDPYHTIWPIPYKVYYTYFQNYIHVDISLRFILPAILGQALTRLVTVSSMCCHTSTSALSTSSSSRGFTS